MLWTGLALLILAAVLLALALRGRVVARGRFCRRCKFDLAGLDAPNCPECGRDLTAPNSTKPASSRAHKPALALAAALFLLGAALTSILTTNNTARILALLPDRVVLTLHALGLDDALTEIATNRLTRTQPLTDHTWRELIRAALSLQADENRPWDPRHGEVLANALVTGRLTDDEVARFIRLAVASDIQFPENIRHGAQSAGMMASRLSSSRVAALNSVGSAVNGPEQIMIWIMVKRAGTRAPDMQADLQSWSGGVFSIPGTTGRSGNSKQFRLDLGTLDWSAVEPETELTFFVDYEITARAMQSGKLIASWPQTAVGSVLVLASDVPVVRLDTTQATLEAFQTRSLARIAPIYVVPKAGQGNAAGFTRVAESEFVTVHTPTGLSGDIYIIHNGRETRFCGINAASIRGCGMQGISMRTDGENQIDEALLQSWLDAGTVTVELRPSARIAEASHDIREILGVTLRFESVPVTGAKPVRTILGEVPDPADTTGRPVDPSSQTQP